MHDWLESMLGTVQLRELRRSFPLRCIVNYKIRQALSIVDFQGAGTNRFIFVLYTS